MGQKNIGVIAGIGAGALLTLIIGFFFVLSRSRNKKKAIAAEMEKTALEAAKAKELSAAPDLEKQLHDQMNEQNAEKARQEAEALMKLKLPAVSTKKTEVLVKHIGAEAKKDPSSMAQVVRTWLHESAQK